MYLPLNTIDAVRCNYSLRKKYEAKGANEMEEKTCDRRFALEGKKKGRLEKGRETNTKESSWIVLIAARSPNRAANFFDSPARGIVTLSNAKSVWYDPCAVIAGRRGPGQSKGGRNPAECMQCPRKKVWLVDRARGGLEPCPGPNLSARLERETGSQPEPRNCVKSYYPMNMQRDFAVESFRFRL